MHDFGIKKTLRLRWKYEWPNRPSKAGMWDNPGKNAVDQAWSNNKDGLAYAIVEGKDAFGNIRELLRVPGSDFLNFQWVAASTVALGRPSGTGRTALIGMKVITREEELVAICDGRTGRKPNTCKNINFATFGR